MNDYELASIKRRLDDIDKRIDRQEPGCFSILLMFAGVVFLVWAFLPVAALSLKAQLSDSETSWSDAVKYMDGWDKKDEDKGQQQEDE